MKNDCDKTTISHTSDDKQCEINLDTVLKEELGEFGVYQLRTVAFLVIPLAFVAWSATEYVFTAARIKTRCLIPECESSNLDGIEFSPEWILNAVPSAGNGFDNCRRYAYINNSVNNEEGVCPAVLFDQENITTCDEYVYENTNTVAYDYGLACNEWRRSALGSFRTAGLFFAVPIVGYISDRWGRRTALIISIFNSAWIGVLRYFAQTYIGFAISELIETSFGSNGISAASILLIEMVGPKYRNVAGPMANGLYALGVMMLGLIAWAVPNWKMLTLTLYIPQFFIILFIWILPESARWYLAKNQFQKAEVTLKNMARLNKKQLSIQTLQNLKENAEKERNKLSVIESQTTDEPWLVVLVFQNKPILLRCAVVPVWWFTYLFVYYGLTVNSVNISGNSYLNFIMVAAVDIPGYVIASTLMSYAGRKPTIMMGFGICACCQFTYLFISSDMVGVSLAVYLIGKCSVAVIATTLYVYTAELFPTNYRHRLVAFCSMMGRIGGTIGPLTPAFGDQLPFILFGGMALLAGLLVLLIPETRDAVFPDTMQEAVKT